MLLKNLTFALAFAAITVADIIPRTPPVPGVCPEGYTEKPNNQCCKTNQPPPPHKGQKCKARNLKPCPRGYNRSYQNGRNYCCMGRNKCIACPEQDCPAGYRGTKLGRSSVCCSTPRPQPQPTEQCVPKPAAACPANYFACPADFFGDCCPNDSFCGTAQENIVCYT